MNSLDIIIILIIVFFGIKGLRNGLIEEVLFLLITGISLLTGFLFYPLIIKYFKFLTTDPLLLKIIGIIVIGFPVFLILKLLKDSYGEYSIEGGIIETGGGFIIGLCEGVAVAFLIFYLMRYLHHQEIIKTLQTSRTYAYFTSVFKIP